MIDLLDYVPIAFRDEVRIKFNYTQLGGGIGVGWYIDDVRLVVSRDENATIIWSGGEPVLDRSFPTLINSIIDRLPHTKHRVITNSVRYSKTLEDLLSAGRISIYILILADRCKKETWCINMIG